MKTTRLPRPVRRSRSVLVRLGLGLGVSLAVALCPVIFGASAGDTGTRAWADAADFAYNSWDVSVEVGTDDDGHAIAHVTETLNAQFPETDQNRGIVRALPLDYQGASTDPRDFAVSDGSGAPVEFDVEEEDGFIAVLTGTDEFLHGSTTYVIEYTLSDVVLARDDGVADEFYWDLIDVEHEQPISRFTAEISFAPELSAALDGNARCYSGAAEAEAECVYRFDGSADARTVQLEPLSLDPFEGVTVGIGLAPGSVVQPASRLPNPLLDGAPLVLGGAATAVGAAGAIAVGALRRKRRTATGTIVAQYDVPRSLPPLIAAPIVGSTTSPVAAQIVHLAVTGILRIEEPAEANGRNARPSRPVLRLREWKAAPAADGADSTDGDMIRALFHDPVPGARFEIPQQNEAFAADMERVRQTAATAATQRGYFERVTSRTGRVLGWISLSLVAVLAVFIVFALAMRESPSAAVGIVAGIIAIVLGVIALLPKRVHTLLGAQTREYLLGVREFIRVAEADRLVMLQSVTGAERQTDDGVEIVHLYERLLPYAILFGQEKQWNKVLEVTYAAHPEVSPTWYVGGNGHGFAATAGLGTTLSSFTNSLNSSVSYTSSSSGGSSGGGYVGGGGGGGFSGGR